MQCLTLQDQPVSVFNGILSPGSRPSISILWWRSISSSYSVIVFSNIPNISSTATVSRWLTKALSSCNEDIFKRQRRQVTVQWFVPRPEGCTCWLKAAISSNCRQKHSKTKHELSKTLTRCVGWLWPWTWRDSCTQLSGTSASGRPLGPGKFFFFSICKLLLGRITAAQWSGVWTAQDEWRSERKHEYSTSFKRHLCKYFWYLQYDHSKILRDK